jgi:hypothetical protein
MLIKCIQIFSNCGIHRLYYIICREGSNLLRSEMMRAKGYASVQRDFREAARRVI